MRGSTHGEIGSCICTVHSSLVTYYAVGRYLTLVVVLYCTQVSVVYAVCAKGGLGMLLSLHDGSFTRVWEIWAVECRAFTLLPYLREIRDEYICI